MKSLLLIVLVCLLPTSTVFSQTLEEREKQIALKNHINTKIQYNHKYTNGIPEDVGVKTSVTTYSTTGNIVKKEYFNSNDVVIGWEKYEYDVNGNRTLYQRENTSSTYKKQSKYSDEDDVLLEAGFNGAENFKNNYSYVAENKPSEIIYSSSNKIEQKLIYKHAGNAATLNIYAGGKTLASVVKLMYDGNGNIIEETSLTTDGQELEKKTYTYSSDSKLLREEKTIHGNFNYRIDYEYNGKGMLLKVIEEKVSQEKFDKKVFSYAASGNLLEYRWRRKAAEEFNIKTYTYNAAGICLTEHTFYPKTKYESLSKFKYVLY